MKADSQARKYQLTINNPDAYSLTREEMISIIQNKLTVDYFCISDEIAQTKTPHTHIFLYSNSPIRFSTIKSKFPLAHIEKAYGTCKQNRDYLLKEGKWEESEKHNTVVQNSFQEFGTMPTETSETAPLMSTVIDELKNGISTAEIIIKYPKLAFKTNDINTLRNTLLSEKYMKENREVAVTYLYGKSGTGKTSSIYKKYKVENICRITNYGISGIKFDQYTSQDVLVFEEFRSQIAIAELLSYLDIYPLMLPARYADKIACYTKVYLVSNIPLSMQYTNIQKTEPATWKALLRRIDHILEQVSFDEQVEHSKIDEMEEPWKHISKTY